MQTYHALGRETTVGFETTEQIEPSEFERYAEAIASVDRVRLQSQFALVERNYRRLRSIRRYYENGYNKGVLGRHNFTEVAFSYNSELVNWLIGTRLFLDHNKVALEHEYGDDPSKVAAYRHATNVEHSQSPTYRVLYNLRDYVQHCDFPVSKLETFLRNGVDRAGGIGLRLQLERDQILENHFNWKGQAKADLEGFPETFEIEELADEFMGSLRRLHWTLIDDRVKRAAEAAPIVSEAYQRVVEKAGPQGRPALMRYTGRASPVGPNELLDIEPRPIPMELARRSVETIEGDIRPSDFVRDLARLREKPAPLQDDEEFNETLQIGVAAVSGYLASGFGARFAAGVNVVIEEKGDVAPVVQGTTLVASIGLKMVALMHGTSTQDILGGIASYGPEGEGDED